MVIKRIVMAFLIGLTLFSSPAQALDEILEKEIGGWVITCYNEENKFSHCEQISIFEGDAVFGDLMFAWSFNGSERMTLKFCGHWGNKVIADASYNVLFSWTHGEQPWHKFETQGFRADDGKFSCLMGYYKVDPNWIKLMVSYPKFKLKLGNAPQTNVDMVGFDEAFKFTAEKAVQLKNSQEG